MFFVFLLSGLFLGWSLGANDAANVYGTAVGSRMVKFGTAAILCSVFLLLGAVFGGAGAAHTYGKLGAVNALGGAFTVALAAALTVTWMTRLKLPVSTSQAIVGAIIGWNLFSGSLTDYTSLARIVTSWVACPILAGIFAVLLLWLAKAVLRATRPHLLRLDVYTRWGLILAGAFASYSLGANNIANVMGVFVPSAPFGDLDVLGVLRLSAAQQLFFLGALAIGVGVVTYSKRVMLTVGNDLFRLSPIAALVVVLAQAIVLFLFSSEGLENWLATQGLPTIPLVPVSSSQAVIGAVIGIGLAKGGRNIQYRVLGKIASGWVSTPLISGAMSFVLLFFVQNVFGQAVFVPVQHEISEAVVKKLESEDLWEPELEELLGQPFDDAVSMRDAVAARLGPEAPVDRIVALARVTPIQVDIELLESQYSYEWFTEAQVTAVFRLHGREYRHEWQLLEGLAALSDAWSPLPESKKTRLYNKELRAKQQYLVKTMTRPPAPPPEKNARARRR